MLDPIVDHAQNIGWRQQIIIIRTMSFVTEQDIMSFLSQKKRTFRLRLCILPDKVVMLTSSKMVYNHKKNCKSCRKIHVTISRDTVDKGLQNLRGLGAFCDGVAKRRKQRVDIEGHHNHPSKANPMSSDSTQEDSDMTLAEGQNLLPEWIPSLEMFGQIGEYTADQLLLQK
eukprot:TRINITY_DN138593_c0_g1_i1.p1 TRINITY_DN138593_c0_g1~~TRINITY_DN138593_c0_g1_i1.p1  ORF type:complete len:171 (+),score=7.94 TRINITY_DN138593_c0_g1_i1:55-567(+)